jgi:HlyD family secretion protein
VEATTGDPEVLDKLGVGKQRKGRRWLTRAFVLIGVAALAGGFFAWRAKQSQAKGETYVTAQVELGDLRETVTATGTLSPLDSVEVGAEVTGRVIKVHVDINDRVEEGQILVELDTEQLKARVEESQAQLWSSQASQKNALATSKEAEAKAARTLELHKRGLASDQERETADATLDRAKASVSSAAAQVTVAQAGLKSAQTALSRAIIRSPITGIVLARSVEPGQTVTAGYQTPILFTLAKDLSQMQLKIDVDEADVGKVKDGQAATFVVDAYPKQNFDSKVVRLSNLPKTGTTVITYEGVLTVDNSDRLLRPGMTATATIVVSEKKGVLSIPNAALRFQPTQPKTSLMGPGLPLPGMGGGMRGGGMRGGSGGPKTAGSVSPPGPEKKQEAVYVQKDGALTRLPIEVGASDGRRTEVVGGPLAQGSAVVIDVAETPQ